MQKLVLASTSPYRRDLLERLRIPFETVSPDLDESALPGEAPQQTALRLAEGKARAVSASFPQALLIGSDQVAVLKGRAIGKPGDHAAAVEQLLSMRGQSVVFHTAVCVLNTATGKVQIEDVPTSVTLRHLEPAQVERYLEIETPYDCAGSARIESLGIGLVERVTSDDPTALIGLPLIALCRMLRNEGLDVI